MRSSRNRNQDATPTEESPTMTDTDYAPTEPDATVTLDQGTTPEGEQAAQEAETPTEGATQATEKRAPRKPIDVGTVTVRKSSRTDFSTRPTRLDSNPVFLAVKDAEKGEPYDLVVEEGKEAGVISILRRAGQKLNVGVNIASAPYPAAEDQPGHVILTFKTADRDVRKGKGTADAPAEQATPDAEVAEAVSE